MQDPAGLGEDPNRTIPDVNTNYSNIWSDEVDKKWGVVKVL